MKKVRLELTVNENVSDVTLAEIVSNVIEIVENESKFWQDQLFDRDTVVSLREYDECTLDDLGRLEVIDIATGNQLATFYEADEVVQYLHKFGIPLSTVKLEWHSEDA